MNLKRFSSTFSNAVRWRLEHVISETGIKPRPIQVLKGLSVIIFGLHTFFSVSSLDENKKKKRTVRQSACHRPTGEQLEIPSPPKKNSSPYATIAVCLVEKHNVTLRMMLRSEELHLNQVQIHCTSRIFVKKTS